MGRAYLSHGGHQRCSVGALGARGLDVIIKSTPYSAVDYLRIRFQFDLENFLLKMGMGGELKNGDQMATPRQSLADICACPICM